jgi:flavin reductase (DIM6/NTAB) family NADH-FMN oxidoreductase RutF
LEPPLVLVCLGHDVSIITHFRNAIYFGISVLADHQQHLSESFARKGQDRFEGVDWYSGATGVPLLSGSLARVECAVHRRIEMGDHDIVVGEMVHSQVAEGWPLIHFLGTYHRLETL